MRAIRVLLPPSAVVARDAPLAFRTLLARADRLEDAARGRAAALARAFAASPSKPLAAAPLLREALCADAGDAVWICADPGHARADLAALRLVQSGDLGLAREEADSLVRALKPLFGDAGFELSAPEPDRWFLRGLVSEQWPETPDPADILGDHLEPHLPQGANGASWRRLLNEAQILLHQHTVNAARVQRGLAPANTLWFWGGGRMAALANRYASVAAVDPVLRAAAARAGAALVSPATWSDAATPMLVETWDRAQWTAFCAGGHEALAARVGRDAEALELECWSGERWSYRRAHRWRFWRKPA